AEARGLELDADPIPARRLRQVEGGVGGRRSDSDEQDGYVAAETDLLPAPEKLGPFDAGPVDVDDGDVDQTAGELQRCPGVPRLHHREAVLEQRSADLAASVG